MLSDKRDIGSVLLEMHPLEEGSQKAVCGWKVPAERVTVVDTIVVNLNLNAVSLLWIIAVCYAGAL